MFRVSRLLAANTNGTARATNDNTRTVPPIVRVNLRARIPPAQHGQICGQVTSLTAAPASMKTHEHTKTSKFSLHLSVGLPYVCSDLVHRVSPGDEREISSTLVLQ